MLGGFVRLFVSLFHHCSTRSHSIDPSIHRLFYPSLLPHTPPPPLSPARRPSLVLPLDSMGNVESSELTADGIPRVIKWEVDADFQHPHRKHLHLPAKAAMLSPSAAAKNGSWSTAEANWLSARTDDDANNDNDDLLYSSCQGETDDFPLWCEDLDESCEHDDYMDEHEFLAAAAAAADADADAADGGQRTVTSSSPSSSSNAHRRPYHSHDDFDGGYSTLEDDVAERNAASSHSTDDGSLLTATSECESYESEQDDSISLSSSSARLVSSVSASATVRTPFPVSSAASAAVTSGPEQYTFHGVAPSVLTAWRTTSLATVPHSAAQPVPSPSPSAVPPLSRSLSLQLPTTNVRISSPKKLPTHRPLSNQEREPPSHSVQGFIPTVSTLPPDMPSLR